MIINIYGLVYPSTQEVIYVGQTRTSIEHRLDSHYIQQLINLIMKNLLLDVKFPTLLKDVKNLKVLLNI